MGERHGPGGMMQAALAPLPILADGNVRLLPLGSADRDELRTACAEDPDIWQIYSVSLLGPAFDDWWAAHVDSLSEWHMFAIHTGDRLAGMTGFAVDVRHPGVVEVGNTYLRPAMRATDVNRRAKWLILSWLFGAGFHRVEFRVDDRNARSKAAVRKLGARHEGLLHRHKRTHTGFVRDTNVFAITDDDWPAIEAALRP